MDKIVTVVTWNISEAHFAKSSKLFDYEHEENLEYFIDELRKIRPDIVCLPEINIPNDHDNASLTSRVASALGFKYSHEKLFHESLFYQDRALGLGLISSMKFSVKDIPLDQPKFRLNLADGTPAYNHTRWLFEADFHSFVFGATHNWPMNIFQRSYESEPGAGYGRYLDDLYLRELPANRSLLLAGDLNFNTPGKVIPQTVSKFAFRQALPQDQQTMNDGSRPDHILYTPAFECLHARIMPSKSDHNLCYATFKINKN
jgi:endonuclease/exonuclease/phosphatase family metal-dependent hydrolase